MRIQKTMIDYPVELLHRVYQLTQQDIEYLIEKCYETDDGRWKMVLHYEDDPLTQLDALLT